MGEVLGFYSSIISEMFTISYESAGQASDANVALEITSMLDLSSTKELSGKERGLVNGLIGLGSIGEDQMRKLQALITPQSIMTANFVHHLPAAHKEEYSKILTETKLEDVQALRDKLISNAADLTATGIDQKTWFGTATARIVKLRELERLVGDNISLLIENTIDNQWDII